MYFQGGNKGAESSPRRAACLLGYTLPRSEIRRETRKKNLSANTTAERFEIPLYDGPRRVVEPTD